MSHRTSDASFPILCVSAIQAFRSVSKRQFQHTTEGTLLSVHAIRTAGCDNLVGPPAWCHLRRQGIICPFLRKKSLRHIVGKRVFRLAVVRETWTQYFLTNALAVDIQFVYTQTGGHPQGGLHFFLIRDTCYKPVGTISCTCMFIHTPLHLRRICHANPL